MKPSKLYIENFMCHEKSFIDFSEFNSALIIGKVENNELFSNGVGKTSIFKAIEYVLFNQADINLEKIIRDGSDYCSVTLDFFVGTQEYRLIRKRNKKSTDLSFYERNTVPGSEAQVYHGDNFVPIIDDLYWKDLSGRRTADTERDLEKLIKINFKSFRNTIHFLQNDFSGLTTSTPEKRKVLFKEALNLIVYSKLEKMAKEKANALLKNIEKTSTLIENIGSPETELDQAKTSYVEVQDKFNKVAEQIQEIQSKIGAQNNLIASLIQEYTGLSSSSSDLLQKEKNLLQEIEKTEISVKEYSTKKSNIIKSAKDLTQEITALQEQQIKLISLDYNQIDILLDKISSIKTSIIQNTLVIKDKISKYEELKIPVPDENICKHCRQPLTEEHKILCKKQVGLEMEDCQKSIQQAKKEISRLEPELQEHQQAVNSLTLSKQKLENINIQITSKMKEREDKKNTFNEYNALLEKFASEAKEKRRELETLKDKIANSNTVQQSFKVRATLDLEKENLLTLTETLNSLNKQSSHLNASQAVLQHALNQKQADADKLKVLKKTLSDLESQYSLYPLVIQGFSQIPNIVTQDVLDELQTEANNLLSQLKPGLQLSFKIEKTKADGSEADTLDIDYQVNGKDRYYEQLSGAMKLAVTFSLKLGLSFLLQKMVGTDIKFLLLDEIDQSLDKASVDAFADIVKFFQKDFIILIITHNDRLKDKFSHAILVEQDINMVSRAKVVSSW